MKISDIQEFIPDIRIKNDGCFESLGLLNANKEEGTFSFIESEKYIKNIPKNVSCVLTKEEFWEKLPQNLGIAVCENPRCDFYKLHNYLYTNSKWYTRKRYETKIGEGSRISGRSSIPEYNVSIGKNVIIEENVVISENVSIGDNSIIRAGSIIGGEGFQFIREGKDKIFLVSHAGGAVLGNNVEVQQNSCIDRAVFPWDDTVIGEYTKIDNLVHIAHADKIGKRCLIAAGADVAGVTTIGDDCWIGLGAVVSNCLNIGKNVGIQIGAVVINDVNDGEVIVPRPSIPLKIDFGGKR